MTYTNTIDALVNKYLSKYPVLTQDTSKQVGIR